MTQRSSTPPIAPHHSAYNHKNDKNNNLNDQDDFSTISKEDGIGDSDQPQSDYSFIHSLIIRDILPPSNADAASKLLGIYPNRRVWLAFFDRALLVVGAICLLLALVFFIAYNWVDMGKMGKFALVEGALLLSVIGYALLAYWRKFELGQQLLLFIASVITGVLLALFGQVYQTGADTWQLFFNWALMITPFVLIARLPALWLLWLGLINAFVVQYFKVAGFFWFDWLFFNFLDFFQMTVLFILNFIALGLWIEILKHDSSKSSFIGSDSVPTQTNTINKISSSNRTLSNQKRKTAYHWSTYVVGLILTYFVTKLAILDGYGMDDGFVFAGFLLWGVWALYMYWQHRLRQVDLLMLTYLCGSAIFVVVFRIVIAMDFDAIDFFIIAVVLIAMSTGAVVWLRHVAQQDKVEGSLGRENTHEPQ